MTIGSYIGRLPRREQENRDWRQAILKKAAKSKTLQEEELGRCKDDILYWVNGYVWQYNPDMLGKETGPFVTFDFQDELIEKIQKCIFTGRDLIIEKSRKMGLTWINLFIMDHYYLFDSWKQFLMISRNADAVDSATPSSLFWKTDFLHRHLPKWMRPREDRTKMSYRNLDTDCVIEGEASTGRAGVGGRALAIFIDEAAHIREMWEVWHRTAATARCRIVNSTHTSSANCFADLVRKKDRTLEHARVHWSVHPWFKRGLYQYSKESNRVEIMDKEYMYEPEFQFVCDGKIRSPWYDYEWERIGDPRAAAMEYDIDPQGSMSQFFDPVKIRSLQAMCCEPFWTGRVDYKSSGDRGELVKDDAGHLHLWCHLPDGKPVPGHYVCGVDVSQGTGNSNSCISILNETGEKIGQYVNANIDPKELAPLAAALGRIFHGPDDEEARFIWEVAGPGMTFGKELTEECFYRNFYYAKDERKLHPKIVLERPGWHPSAANQLMLLQAYRSALYEGKFCNRSRAALEECLDFRYTPNGQVEHARSRDGADPSGARANHGDRVIADALAWKECRKLMEPVTRKEKQEVPYGSLAWRRQLRERQEQADDPIILGGQ